MNENKLLAGAAQVDITPQYSLHLAGYPFVKRNSTGFHDKLLSSALYFKEGDNDVLFIGNDVIFIPKDLSLRARKRINKITGIPEKNIVVSATHTHSSPSTIEFVSGGHDKLLPPVEERFLQQLEDGIVDAGVLAIHSTEKAKLFYSVADATGVGTNRHNPEASSDMEVPVLLAKNVSTSEVIGCMIICNMHPTVLHEDSTLFSGDFPGLARLHLQKTVFRQHCPIVYHIGTAGNQSPRHVTKANNFKEAKRIGKILSDAVALSLHNMKELEDIKINVLQSFIDLPHKEIPEIAIAAANEIEFAKKLAKLRLDGATAQNIRSAEVNWFGATELLNLAHMNVNGTLKAAYDLCMPAEIQVIKIGKLNFVAWPGEIFVEYGLKIKEAIPDTFVLTLANGDLQVYIATKEAVEAGVYEANNAIFDYTSGGKLVEETISLLKSQ
jgi:neutral ceramidase